MRSSKKLLPWSKTTLFITSLQGNLLQLEGKINSQILEAKELRLCPFQEACLSLREKIVSAVERVDENLDLDSMFEMEETEKAMVYHTYTETMHLCYNVGFEVHITCLSCQHLNLPFAVTYFWSVWYLYICFAIISFDARMIDKSPYSKFVP